MSVGVPPRRSLLIVDDDVDILRLVSLAMKARDFEVATASTLEEGVTQIERTVFDVVLTDKNLKGATGLELIDALSIRSPTTAIVLMTAYPEGALGRLASLDGYLAKPFKSLDVVAQTLHDAVERRGRALQRQKLLGQLGDVKTALSGPPNKRIT
ncbi:MAG: response regulator [Myxococcaceae bacterium]|jgi:DNA-binding NtrC family response regulator|nr:response regulator [Myxococcaceae bacterium]